MTNILVTGCAGFIGSHVIEALLSQGERVIGIDDFNNYYDPLIKRRNIEPVLKNPLFLLVNGDIRDKETLERIFRENKINKVVHLAARAGVRASFENPEIYKEVNLGGTRNLLELSAKEHVENFIFASSSSVYGENKKIPFSEDDEVKNQISPYAKTKIEGEKLCEEVNKSKGLPIVCLRFFTVYGPRGRPDMAPFKFTKLISDEEEIELYGDGTSKRDYTFISDIVQGIVSALNRDFNFEIINLGNERPINLLYFVELIEKNVGKKAKVKKVGEQKGDVPITYADIKKAKKLLGYDPKTPIEEGIRKTVEWYKEEYN